MPRQSAYLSDPEKAYVEYRADDWECSQGEVIKRLIRSHWYGDSAETNRQPTDRAAIDVSAIQRDTENLLHLLGALGRGLDVDLESEFARLELETRSMPGRESHQEERRAAVFEMWRLLRDRGVAGPSDFVDELHDGHSAGYGNTETWWRNLSPVLASLGSVDRVSNRRYRFIPAHYLKEI